MNRFRGRHKPSRETEITGTKIEGGFLRVHEEGLIPRTALGPTFSADKLCRTLSPIDDNLSVVYFGIADDFPESMDATGATDTQKRFTERAGDRWFSAHGLDEHALRV